MKALVRGGLVAAMALTLTAATFNDASASRRGRVAAGVVGGLIVGGIIAGAAANSARASGGTYYVAPRPRASCSEYKRRAIWNEDNGRYNRARYYWDQYEACING